MREFKWNDGLRSRSRTPHLWVRKKEGGWTRFKGQGIHGLIAIASSKYQKNGKWSNTDYTLVVNDETLVVEVCKPFNYWGDTWEDMSEGITLMSVPSDDVDVDKTEIARQVLPKYKRGSNAEAAQRAIENEAILQSILLEP